MNLLEKVITLEDDAAGFGFRWETSEQIMAQIESECVEISEHLHAGVEHANQAELQEEIGDLLHAVFSLCVFCKMNPSVTLEKTLMKFERRMNAVKGITEEKGLVSLNGCAFDELMDVWEQAKERVG